MWIEHQRFIYNAKVREARYWRAFARRALALTGQAYSQFIGEDTAGLREVPSQILRNGAYRFANGCARARSGLGGAPTARKKHGRQSVLVTSELFRFEEHTDPDPPAGPPGLQGAPRLGAPQEPEPQRRARRALVRELLL